MGMTVVFFSTFVEMEVGMRFGIMGMGMQMESLSLEGAPQNANSKSDQHKGYQKLQAQSSPRRDCQAQADAKQANNKERNGMTQTPESPYQGGPFKALMLADNRRDCDHMIRIQGMLNAEDQSQTKGSIKG